MSESDEEETYIVKIERGRNKEFGNWISEMWINQSTGEYGRPDDKPAFHRYDPKTKETLEAEYKFEGPRSMARKTGEPFYINRGSIAPHIHYRLNKDTVRTVWPCFEADEKTRRLKYENYDTPRQYLDSPASKTTSPEVPEP